MMFFFKIPVSPKSSLGFWVGGGEEEEAGWWPSSWRPPLRLSTRGGAVPGDSSALCRGGRCRDEVAEVQQTLEQVLVHSPLTRHLFF